MNKYIVASCLLAIALGWSISSSNKCSCDQYNLQGECTGFCNWNATTSVCAAQTCNGQTQAACLGYPSNCYWNSTACLSFSSCSSLTGNTTAACQSQNGGCTYTTGNNCVANSCGIYNSTNCPATCLVSGTSCTTPTSCGSYNSSNCPAGVSCAVSGSSCVNAVCSNLTSAACFFVSPLTSSSSLSITPCYVNGGNCTDASASNLNTTSLCQTNTAGLYHWSSKNATDGSCVACYGILVQIMFALLLLLA